MYLVVVSYLHFTGIVVTLSVSGVPVGGVILTLYRCCGSNICLRCTCGGVILTFNGSYGNTADAACAPLWCCGNVLPHMRILARTHMGCPICVYSYVTPIRVWDSILSHMGILFACFISSQVFGYCCYK